MSDKDDITFNGVEIRLDKVRHLKYSLQGLRIVTKKYGSLQNAINKLQGGGEDVSDEMLDILSTLVHAGLIWEDETLTQDFVEKIIEFKHIAILPEKILEAVSNSLPAAQEGNSHPQSAKRK